ncbi:PA0069 family radical SAM protein [Thiococcus pfennigii]|uniref:PA0069 family radical SAM protein n=1 Tax=Thiococcus pfennigii TaxID=1057 RepID=UPI001906FFD4|nr:PA0069 family radical SAM protein [Thiococcus pfennigii]MBK1730251.1 radical SAM protein [Thiococcus pfennigii]
MAQDPAQRSPHRGALSNPDGRYAEHRRETVDDGWWQASEEPLRTTVEVDASRRVISYNASPDIPFDRAVNPYRGCEHGCLYCYARPSHAWLGLSPGLDFETRLFYKPDAATQLARELAAPGYRPAPLALGSNTDPYQPLERRLGLTRAVLEVLHDWRHPAFITTKSALVLRDLERLAAMARENLIAVRVSLATLDAELARRLEPRAASPTRRLATIEALAEAGVPVGVLVSPVIPGLTDVDLERILARAAEAGARMACSQLIRLPHELKDLFQEWLQAHYPDRAAKVLDLIRQCRGGRLNDPRFGHRHSGSGPIAALIAQRFALAARRAGLGTDGGAWHLDSRRFSPPGRPIQRSLFEAPT